MSEFKTMCNSYINKMYERVKLLCDVESYSGPATSNSVIFDTQRHKEHSIEILVENETEQMNNETALQVSERNRF
jgi:hypothetical protein